MVVLGVDEKRRRRRKRSSLTISLCDRDCTAPWMAASPHQQRQIEILMSTSSNRHLVDSARFRRAHFATASPLRPGRVLPMMIPILIMSLKSPFATQSLLDLSKPLFAASQCCWTCSARSSCPKLDRAVWRHSRSDDKLCIGFRNEINSLVDDSKMTSSPSVDGSGTLTSPRLTETSPP
jgi:hypothetical protein